MKAFIVENNYRPSDSSSDLWKEKLPYIGWYLIADSALTNTGKPFYLPENKGTVTVSLGIAIKVSRLGKSISPKFAKRYYSEIAPVVHFSLCDFRNQLEKKGLAIDSSENFDRSLFVGTFRNFEKITEVTLSRNGKETMEWQLQNLIRPIDEVLSELSVMNTMKMGDLIIPGLSSPKKIEIGDRLEVFLKGNSEFLIKVK